MKNFRWISVSAFLVVLSAASQSQTVKAVLNISDPLDSVGVTLAQGRDGRLYGMSSGFGSTQNPDGTFFRVNPDGSAPTVLSALSGLDGQDPIYGVTLAADGNYYGTTIEGGGSGSGVLFKVSPTGSYTVLDQLSGGSNSVFAAGPPIQASDGNFYGATETGGGNYGSIYKYAPTTNSFTTILSLTQDGSQGTYISAPLIQASDGSLYGTTQAGGTNHCGTIINLNTSGVLLHVYSFSCGPGGNLPLAPLYQASDGSLYGTTNWGGNVTSSGECANGCGTIFKLNHGIISIIYRFSGYPQDGAFATTGLIQGTDGNLYGGTVRGGSTDIGTLYQITTSGQYKLLYSFSGANGDGPPSSLMQHTNGKFYGSTRLGGQNSTGAIYSLDMGLGPFISLVRYTGRIGQPVQILGQGLTGSTAVTVNGIAATSFKVVTDRYMTAVVPTGATTGAVVVTTATGTLTSNHNFRIVQ